MGRRARATQDHAELVAHHYEAALELARAAGADPAFREEAAAAFLGAGDRAARLGSFPGARRYYELASELVHERSPNWARTVLALAQVRFITESDPEVPRVAAERLAAAGAVEEAIEASVVAATALWRAGRLDEGEAVLERAWTLAAERPDSAAVAALAAEAGRFAVFAGRPDEAEELCGRAAEIAARLGLDEVRAQALNTRAVVAMMDGEFPRALALYTEVIESTASTAERSRAMANTAVAWLSDLFAGRAEEWGQAAVELAARTGNRKDALWTRSGEIEQEMLEGGAWDDALEAAHGFLDDTEAIGGHYLDNSVRLCCARILAYRGERAEPLVLLERALDGVDAANPQSAIPLLIVCAEVLLGLGELERARELAERALRRAEESRARAPAITAAAAATYYRLDLSQQWLRLFETKFAQIGRVWAARLIMIGRADDAAELYAWGGSPLEEATTRLLAFEQLLAEGRRAEADAQLERALVFYRRVGATSILERAHAHLAAAS